MILEKSDNNSQPLRTIYPRCRCYKTFIGCVTDEGAEKVSAPGKPVQPRQMFVSKVMPERKKSL
jgi:hypothetical protein